MEYLKFLKENNIECIATYFNWVYLRKKAAYGPFDIYSDKESKLKHYKRILNFWFLILIFEFTLFISNVYNLFIFNSSESTKLIDRIYSFNSVLLIPILFILILLFKITISLYRKIKKLESEKKIIE